MGDITKILGHSFTPLPDQAVMLPETQLWQAMASDGIDPPDGIAFDGELHRFGHKDAGWYRAYLDPPIAVYGDWRLGIKGKLICDIDREYGYLENLQLLNRLKELAKEAEHARGVQAEYSAGVAEKTWENAQEASKEHPYLQRKGIKPNGARVASDGRLIVPLYRDGELVSLQYIAGDGEKRYQEGCISKGAWHLLGEVSESVFIAEGFATAATIYEETGIATATAYSSGNILATAEALRKAHPTALITVVADLDESGIGKNYAEQASAKYGCRVILCPVPSDVNDYRLQGGDVAGLLTERLAVIDKLKIYTGDQISDEYQPPDEVIEDLLTSESVAMLYGASHSGKTFFALSLAVAVANGDKIFGKHTDKGKVLYLATEAPRTIRDRLQAVKRYQCKDISNIYVVPVPINLYTSNEPVYDIIAACREIGNVKMIVGDTLARISAGADENGGKDMGPVMEKFDLIAHETGASVLIIHHSGKDTTKGGRGWSGVPAHLDAEIEIKNDGEHGEKVATIKKQRELGTTGQEIQFKLKVVEMGVGKFGSQKTSCIVESDKREKKGEIGGKRKSKDELYFEFFKRAWFASGAEYDGRDPYITKSALRNKMVDDSFANSDRTIDNHLSPSYPGNLVGSLIAIGVLEQRANGFAVIDDKKASIMNLEAVPRNPPKSPEKGK